MDESLILRYEQKAQCLEEPVREIVPAIWRLPYVVDTEGSCSGHMLAQYTKSVVEYPYIKNIKKPRRYAWYPQGPALELVYSLDEALVQARDSFRADLKRVFVGEAGVTVSFNDIHTFDGMRRPGLFEVYRATLPYSDNEPVPYDVVLRVESLLASFWDRVAAVVSQHNEDATITSVKGKNFRRVIDWAKWGVES